MRHLRLRDRAGDKSNSCRAYQFGRSTPLSSRHWPSAGDAIAERVIAVAFNAMSDERATRPGTIGPAKRQRFGAHALNGFLTSFRFHAVTLPEGAMTDLVKIAADIAARGKILDSDIMAIRGAVFGDDIVSRAEAEALFGIERARTAHNRAWSELFAEALTDYCIRQEPPEGFLSESTAAWVMTEIARNKSPSTDAELELLIALIEKAREVPAAFSAFALGHVKSVVMYGGGPDARGRAHDGGRISQADIHALERILWGAGTEGHLAISRDEAEALFGIANASAGADNDERFEDLFAKAIGNYLLGATGRAVPSRDVALRWEAEETHLDAARLLRSVMQTYSTADWSKLRDRDFWADSVLRPRSLSEDVDAAFEAQLAARKAAEDVASVMTPEKAAWLLDHIGRNGVMTPPEKALARFIARNTSRLDPSLARVLDKASA
jgi:hypothetical protein